MKTLARAARAACALAGLSFASPAWTENGEVEAAASPTPVAPAEAAPPGEPARQPPGFSLSLRLGLALPRGHAFATSNGGVPLRSDVYLKVVPIHLDAGFLLLRRFVVGGYVELAHVVVEEHGGGPAEEVCRTEGVSSCSGVSLRLGLQTQVKLLVDRPFEPWVGVGTGYELLWYTADGKDGVIRSRKYAGWELLSAHAGVDLRVARLFAADFRIGPYGSVCLGRYGTTAAPSSAAWQPANHQWVELGLRGTLETPRPE